MTSRDGCVAGIDLQNPTHRAIAMACRNRLVDPTATALTDQELVLELGRANSEGLAVVAQQVEVAVREVAVWKYGADMPQLSATFDRDAAIEFLVRTGLVTTELLDRVAEVESANQRHVGIPVARHSTSAATAVAGLVARPVDSERQHTPGTAVHEDDLVVVPTSTSPGSRVPGSTAWPFARTQHIAIGTSALTFGVLVSYGASVVGVPIAAAILLGAMAGTTEGICGILLVTSPPGRGPWGRLRLATAVVLAVGSSILLGDLVLAGVFAADIREEIDQSARSSSSDDIASQLAAIETATAKEAARIEQQRSTLQAQADSAETRAQQDRAACDTEVRGTGGGTPGFGPRAKVLCGAADQSGDDARRVREEIEGAVRALDEEHTQLVRETARERDALEADARRPHVSAGLLSRFRALDTVVAPVVRVLFAVLLASLWVAPVALARERLAPVHRARAPSV